MSKRIILALCAIFLTTSVPALADGQGHGKRGHRDREVSWQDHHYKRHHLHKKRHRAQHRHGKSRVVWHSGRHWNPPARVHRHLRHHVYRPVPAQRHGAGYGRRHRDDDWALYTILALQIADALNESQRQSYAWAQRNAVTAPVGDSIRWNDGGAYGRVIATREGSDTAGRYCREFQQEVTVGNQRQSGYGIACRQPDGAWEIVS